MNRFFVLFVSAAVMWTAAAEAPSAEQMAMRAKLYGIGEGLATAVSLSSRPNHVSDNIQHYAVNGLRVEMYKPDLGNYILPVSVETTTPAVLRAINHDLPEMSGETFIGQFGEPDSHTANSLHYRGMAEICSDYMDIGLKDGKVASISWTFCSD